MAKSNYSVGDPQAEQLIQDLVDYCGNDVAPDLLREILTTIVKMGVEHNDRGDFKLTNTTLKELRHAYRVFLPYRQKRKVVIFGSARTPESDPSYQMALETARAVVERGHMVITAPSGRIHNAANRGAGRENSFGINIRLPKEQRANLHIEGDTKLMQFKYFFTRKLMFIKESDATILFPGGSEPSTRALKTSPCSKPENVCRARSSWLNPKMEPIGKASFAWLRRNCFPRDTSRRLT